MNKSVVVKKRTLIQYLLCYLLILTSGAVLWTYVLDFIGFKALVVLLIDIVLIIKYRIKVPMLFVAYSIVLMAFLIILTYITDGYFIGNDFNSTLSMLIYALLAYVIYKIDETSSSLVYIRTVSFFAIVSIFFWGIQVVFGSKAFPEFLFTDVNYRAEYGYLFYTICKIDLRNYGIFYEPGVYQTVLSVALFLLLYNDNLILKKTERRKYLVVLVITMLTTKSTTGYLSLAFLLIPYVLSRNGRKRLKALVILGIIVGIIGLDCILNANDSLLFRVVLAKFAGINFSNGRYNYASSGGARVYLIDIALRVLSTRPFTGLGANSLFSEHFKGTYWETNGAGNILCMTIAKRGILFTLFCISFFLLKAFNNKNSIYSFIAFVLVFFNTVFAQSQLVYAVFAFAAFSNLRIMKLTTTENHNFLKTKHCFGL